MSHHWHGTRRGQLVAELGRIDHAAPATPTVSLTTALGDDDDAVPRRTYRPVTAAASHPCVGERQHDGRRIELVDSWSQRWPHAPRRCCARPRLRPSVNSIATGSYSNRGIRR